MNNNLKFSATPISMGSAAFLATLAFSTPGSVPKWPTLEDPAFVTDGVQGTFSITPGQPRALGTNDADFIAQISAVYASLFERQEPLGASFEAIWDANIDQLYEA